MTTQTLTHEEIFSSQKQFYGENIYLFRRNLEDILEAIEQIYNNKEHVIWDEKLKFIKRTSIRLLNKANHLDGFESFRKRNEPELSIHFPEVQIAIKYTFKHSSGKYTLQQKLYEIILDHLGDQNLTPQVICRKMGMSRTQLYRKIKNSANIPLVQLIRSVRLNVAHQLLLNTSMNIGEVSCEVGFNSQSYFSRVFLNEFGIRPKEVRHLRCSKIK